MPKGKGYDVKDLPRGSGLFDRAARGIMKRQERLKSPTKMDGDSKSGMSRKDLERGYSKPDGD